ncbi:hypothetical protein [Mucilaginibacter sp.]|uniref:hypothetical protein n=1 Tax=Mucilaginibacter sp. TaxID=1882438 RepID=UPI00284D40FB|nr:hypothetical protein [Mucilaginibacter sp.]MDR3693232.1 hypothetical protein [Mucilaginibacter sp.]
MMETIYTAHLYHQAALNNPVAEMVVKKKEKYNLGNEFATIFTNGSYKWKQFSIIVIDNQI